MQYKKIQELTIRDNFMFGAVMSDAENCRSFLELVLGFPIGKVTVSKEKSMVYHPEYKGIRVDIIADDQEGTHYNVELQMVQRSNIRKRSRYYHSHIDMELLERGSDYEELPSSYVIFICDFDLFGYDKYRYTFRSTCKEDSRVELEDGCHTIFLNARGKNKEDVPEGLVKFLKYVRAELAESMEDFEDAFIKRLQASVQKIKASREMGERYMGLSDMFQEEREEGLAEGMAKAVFEILDILGEPIPDDLRKRIENERNFNTLKSYLRKAHAAKNIEEFSFAISQQ